MLLVDKVGRLVVVLEQARDVGGVAAGQVLGLLLHHAREVTAACHRHVCGGVGGWEEVGGGRDLRLKLGWVIMLDGHVGARGCGTDYHHFLAQLLRVLFLCEKAIAAHHDPNLVLVLGVVLGCGVRAQVMLRVKTSA